MTGATGTPAGYRLAERIRRGDRSAEEEFARRYRSRAFAVALAKLGDYEAAEGVTQEALVCVLEALRCGTVQQPGRLGAFVSATARNLANNRIRFARRHSSEGFRQLESGGESPEERAARHECGRLLEGLIHRVDELDRKILLWSIVDGLTSNEIALRLGQRPAAVRQRKRRALDRIKKDLESG